MGEIFLGEHTGLAGFAKRVVVKRIRPELARDANYVRLFLNEARLGSFLNHPNIVHIFDVGHENDDLWLVMEYVDGVDLKRLARRARLPGRPLTPVTVGSIMVKVLSALIEAHAGGALLNTPIIHRDLSPENILVARSGAIKVLDFGLAKYAPDSERVPSMEGDMIFGKVRYMPPEQLKGHHIDVRADLFSLGVVMYQVLKGELPFGRGNANQVLARVMGEQPPSPTGGDTGADEHMDRIVFKAMSPKAADRYQTATEMRDDLLAYVRAHAQEAFPLEMLRRRLVRGPHLEKGDEIGEWAHDPEDRAITEISLSVAERCGKCGAPFNTFFLEGMLVDRCSGCEGIWLDHGELERIMSLSSEAPTMAPLGSITPARLDQLVGSCPTCRVGLNSYEVPGQPASLEICPHCIGVWFDHDEVQLLSHGSVVDWLRKLLQDHLRVR